MTNHRLADHVKMETLRETTKLLPIMSLIKSKTRKLFGHIKRSKTGLSKVCLEGMITGVRSRGSQPKRWRDNIYEWSGLDQTYLNIVTQDRTLWKAISLSLIHI